MYSGIAFWRNHCISDRRKVFDGGTAQNQPLLYRWNIYIPGIYLVYIDMIYITFTFQLNSYNRRFLPSATFWTSRGHRCRPFPPPVRAFNFHRAQGSAFPQLVDFHRMLLTHALALSADQFLCKKKYVPSITRKQCFPISTIVFVIYLGHVVVILETHSLLGGTNYLELELIWGQITFMS